MAIAADGPPLFNRMEPAMSKILAAALALLTLAIALNAVTGEAQARPRFGTGLAIGLAAGTIIGIAASSTAAEPVYDCRDVERYDRFGNLRVIKVCDAAPY
jgi:hypothetical protein